MNSRIFTVFKSSLIIPLLLCFHANASGQQANLRVGDKFSYPIVDSVLNVPNGTLDLASYKGKLIILDFWGPGCVSCIAAFPKLDSLQRVHNDVLKIIAVNKQDRQYTLRYLEKLKNAAMPSFPMITSDSLLHLMFPHSFVPHHVWIDTVGRVLFITSGTNTNGKHIRDYFRGVVPDLANIQNPTTGLVKSLLIEPAEAYQPYYSLITKAIPGISTLNSVPMSKMGKITGNRIARSNASLIDLYSIAYSEGGRYNFLSPESWEISDADKTKFIKPKADSLFNEWYVNHCYHYDLRVSSSLAPSIYRFMKEDLNRYFGLDAAVTRKRRKAYVLRIFDKTLFSKKVAEAKKNVAHMGDTIYFRDWDMPNFTLYLQNLFLRNGVAGILVDGTNHRSAITIALHNLFLQKFSVSALNDELKKYGLELEHKWKKVSILRLETP